ncbi:hypothetical protein [Acinetobacter wuhouensis]|uniref:Nucleoid-associated protein n=1 Tax=Acinetobacter wuhouensis TaxID=1879050 RepID=A0A3G2T1V4_9GAMM|nr:hypothetical protein [Acinetobacter wuhouensis]AYO54220.1 hypothetical protein CDG68_11500 [Acinetobacter wuhouensis]
MSITLQNYSFYSVSVENPEPIIRSISGDSKDVQKYLENVIREAITPPKNQERIRGQYFKFKSMAERVASNLKAITLDEKNETWDEKVKDNAIKLLETERKAQEKIESMGRDIRKGCLLQIKCKIDDVASVALVKIDDKTYLDEEVMQFKKGLPLDTRVQKLAIIKFDAMGNDISLLLSDTNTSISQYWRDHFIVAEAIRDSKTNTQNAFNAIDNLLKRKIKTKSKNDYILLRNQLIIDFRQPSFAFNDFVEKVKSHEPLGEDLDQEIFKKFIVELEKPPEDTKKSFDTQFDIESKIIKARLNNNKIVIDENFELSVKGEVADLKSRLGVGIDEKTQRKFVKIYSDEGYNTFEHDFSED